MTEWSDLDEWWLEEVDDPAYAQDVLPMLLDVLQPQAGCRYLDLGCGEGRVLGQVIGTGALAVGVDVNPRLLSEAADHGPVILGRLPDLEFIGANTFDGAYVVLAIEHIHDLDGLLAECARVVRPEGVLAIVLNHPIYTAPDSGPVLDQTDGEIYWRFGSYLEPGATIEPAGPETVEFVHRPLSMLLTAAARAGWALERMEERGVGSGAERDPLLARHDQVPHLMAVRWRRGPMSEWRGIVAWPDLGP